MAYVSNETGRTRSTYAPSLDASAGRWQVSNEGGSEPHWSRDGEELFYRSEGRELVAIRVQAGETFRTAPREILFSPEGFWFSRFQRTYDVASDGRFVMLRRTGGSGREEIVIVESFVEELEQRIAR